MRQNFRCLKIERAIALVDPMGLIRMGAPFDEYASEAEDIDSLLAKDFRDHEFVMMYYDIMRSSFGEILFNKTNAVEETSMLAYLRDSTAPDKSFRSGGVYRVLSRIEIKSHHLNKGDIVVCAQRESANTLTSELLLILPEGEILADKIERTDESRTRWFFEEIKN